jgi:hypothetical protein
MKLLDAGAMDRIAKAAGSQPANQDNLRLDLLRCRASHGVGILLRQQNKSLERKLTQIAKAARKLQQLLRDDRVWLELVTNDNTVKNPGKIFWYLDRLVNAASYPKPVDSAALAALTSRELEPSLQERSPFEWLVGVGLPRVYQEHFQSEAGYTRNPVTDAIHGQYIDFVEAALHEFDIKHAGAPYTRAAIADALGRAKANRSRRK